MLEATQPAVPSFPLGRRPARAGGRGAGAPPRRTSWTRVLLVSGYLVVTFAIAEHDFAQAGVSVASQDEQQILDRNTEGAEQGNPLRMFALLAFAGVGVATLATGRQAAWRPHPLGLALLLLLAAWAALSIGWAFIPTLAARRYLAWLCFVAGCFGLGRILGPADFVRVALVASGTLIAMSLAADLAAGAGPWRAGYRFGGTLHPNVQATCCTTLCLAGLCLACRPGGTAIYHAMWVVGLGLVYLTGSRTGMLASAATLAAAWLLRRGAAIRWLSVGAAASAAGMLLICLFLLPPTDQRRLTGVALLGRTEKAGTLSGRVPLWEELYHYAADRPLRGYGYDSFWTPAVMEDLLESQRWAMTSAHNIYLETVLQVGLVGLALGVALTVLTLALAKRRFDQARDAASMFVFGLLLYAMLNGLLEAHFLRPKFTTALALMGFAGLVLFPPSAAGPAGRSRSTGENA